MRCTHRVLVIEYSQPIGSLLTDALQNEGCEAVLARTADEGIGLAQALHPSLIAVDYAYASDVVPSLRSSPATRDTPIIAISAPARDLEPALLGQLTRVFRDPFYPSDVVTAILETLRLTASSSARPAARH